VVNNSLAQNLILFKILLYNIVKNNCNNVIAINEGVGNVKSHEKMLTDINYTGNKILNDKFNKKFYISNLYKIIRYKSKMYDVKINKIDNVMNKYDILNIDFLKMDIEGYEIKALKGYSNIKKGNILVLESHRNLDELLYILKIKRYDVSTIHIEPIDGFCSIIHAKH